MASLVLLFVCACLAVSVMLLTIGCCTLRSRRALFILELNARAALVWQAIQGQWMSSCLGVLLELKIPDLLAKEDKPIALQDVSFWVVTCAHWHLFCFLECEFA